MDLQTVQSPMRLNMEHFGDLVESRAVDAQEKTNPQLLLENRLIRFITPSRFTFQW
jgi:hypothetical protein